MSQENVEALRGMYEEFRRGNFAVVMELLDPEIEWHWTSEFMALTERRSFRGLDGVREAMADLAETFERFSTEAEEFFDAGDRVVVFVRNHGRLKGSTAEVEYRIADVYTFRNDRIVRIDNYADRAEALEAVGLVA